MTLQDCGCLWKEPPKASDYRQKEHCKNVALDEQYTIQNAVTEASKEYNRLQSELQLEHRSKASIDVLTAVESERNKAAIRLDKRLADERRKIRKAWSQFNEHWPDEPPFTGRPPYATPKAVLEESGR